MTVQLGGFQVKTVDKLKDDANALNYKHIHIVCIDIPHLRSLLYTSIYTIHVYRLSICLLISFNRWRFTLHLFAFSV